MKKLAFLLLAAAPALLNAQTDNFDDGTDRPEWTRYNPIGVGSFSLVNGGYRLQTAPSPGQAFGNGRAGAFRMESNYTDFYVTVDIVNWDTNLNQAFGLLGRVTDIGAGTSDGYAMTWDAGGRDLDISVFTNERPVNVSGQAGGAANLEHGKSYRMVFMGQGALLTGEIYELPNFDTPLASISVEDLNNSWTNGVCGLIVFDNSNQANPGRTDATFDNYFALHVKPPRLKITPEAFFEFWVTWPPADAPNHVLQYTTRLGAGWEDIPENEIGEFEGRKRYVDSTFAETRFYRLRPPTP